MLLGLETFSYHLAFAYGEMDIFGFIERTASLGLDGVEINVEGNDLCHLGDDDPGFLRDVRALTEQHGLFVELDTCNTDPANLTRVLRLCEALGADRLRVYSSVGGDARQEMRKAIDDFRQVVGLAGDLNVKIGFENHEYETSRDVLDVVRQVNSEYLGAHVDTGNSMMVWEDPLQAVEAMAPYAVSTHFKDHMVVSLNGRPMIVGVPLGEGSIDCGACLRILEERSSLERINIEVCYGYVAPFRVPESDGAGARLGAGAFRVVPPPYAPEIVAPYLLRAAGQEGELRSFAWQELAAMPSAESERCELVRLQDRAVAASVEYVRQLNGQDRE